MESTILRSKSGFWSNKTKRERLVFRLLGLSAVVVMAPVVAVIFFLLIQGVPALNWTFLTQMPENGMREGGIMPAIVGTLMLMAGTVIFSVPVGVLAAIYLTEYAKANTFTRLIRLAIVNLAGVPSIVCGLFGLGFFILFLHISAGRSVLAGTLTLALMTLPVIITSTEEALLSVPKSFRDGSLALGATKWYTIWRIVLPNSAAGIITGVILGVGRAAGETAPIMFTAAAYYTIHLPKSPLNECMALPYHLYVLAAEGFAMPPGVQWGTAVTLLLIVLSMNIVATVIRSRFRRMRTW